jgi:signal transduction histidine kinase/ActR/RegA family two-component response regulator
MNIRLEPRGWLAAAWKATAARIRCGRGRALRRARLQARLAEARLREAIDLLPEGVVFLDAEGRYLLWNRRYAEIYHRSADLFAPGRRLVDTLRVGVARGDYPDAIGREEAWIAERMGLMEDPGVRHEQQLSDGRWIMIEERATSDGGVVGLRVDITEMKRQARALEEALGRAEAANRAKSEFLANMSHEIRTPLNGVLGLAGVLERTPLDEGQRDLVRTILASAGALDVLLSDLLAFARLESGRVELACEPFRLDEAVREAVRLFEPQAAAKGLALSFAAASEACATVLGDAARLKQVVVNLVSNAVKFTDEGSVEAALGRRGSGEAARFVLEVSDTGIGFAPGDADRLFLRFEQADGSITRRFGGTGLGLAICRQLTDLMGGTIRAEGDPGRGARFVVELPLPLAGPDAAVAPEPAAAPAAGLRVLVAEDNATNRKVAELMLAAVGASVVCVEDGRQALEALGAARYDLVLMDLQMPVMDGLTALRTLRAQEAAAGQARTPVVVLSANVMPEHLAASQAAGADGHVGKPIRAAELLAALAQARSGPATLSLTSPRPLAAAAGPSSPSCG